MKGRRMKAKLDELDLLRVQNLTLRFLRCQDQIARSQDEANRINQDMRELNKKLETAYEFDLIAGDKLNPETGEIERAPKANGKSDTKEATA